MSCHGCVRPAVEQPCGVMTANTYEEVKCVIHSVLQLLCPKCSSKLGSFNWYGEQCSCGRWVTPAFQIHKNRVDEIKHIDIAALKWHQRTGRNTNKGVLFNRCMIYFSLDLNMFPNCCNEGGGHLGGAGMHYHTLSSRWCYVYILRMSSSSIPGKYSQFIPCSKIWCAGEELDLV